MRKPKYDDKVIKILRSSPLKAAQIAKTLSLRPGTMYKVLDRLIETGAVVKNGFFYSAATTENQGSPGKEAVLNTLVDKFVNKAPVKSFLEKEIELVTDELNESLSKVYVLKAVKTRLMIALENSKKRRAA